MIIFRLVFFTVNSFTNSLLVVKMLANKRKYKSDSSTSGRMLHDEWTCRFGVIIEHEVLCRICKLLLCASTISTTILRAITAICAP